MTSFILNVEIHPAPHSAPMETSECFIFGKICACLDVRGNIGKYNSPSIVDIVICPLGHFLLTIFVVGHTLFRWADTDMKFPMHHESATAEFYCSILFLIIFCAREKLVHIYVFLMPL